MINFFSNTDKFFSSICLCMFFLSCNNNAGTKKETIEPAKPVIKAFIKPPSGYNDTLIVNYPAAVFYQPDSLQLLKIKDVEDPNFYESSMHEYFFQMLTSRKGLKKNWPGLKIVETNKCRFVLFVKKDKTREYVDLNTKNDTHGLFVFDGKKSPILVDMTNSDTIISFYLKDQVSKIIFKAD